MNELPVHGFLSYIVTKADSGEIRSMSDSSAAQPTGRASLLSEQEHRAQLRRAVIASTVGTTIEWYDFFLYSTVTGLVFAKLYFPRSDPLVGTLQAFGIYLSASPPGRSARRSSAIRATASGARRR